MNDEAAIYVVIGERLKDARGRASERMTQDDLASLVGLERTSVTNIEAGRQKAPLHVLYLLARALGVELKDLVPTSSELAPYRSVQEIDIGGEARSVSASIAAIVGSLPPSAMPPK
jgi:transcriptional regulator with XRE-family HTH domain